MVQSWGRTLHVQNVYIHVYDTYLAKWLMYMYTCRVLETAAVCELHGLHDVDPLHSPAHCSTYLRHRQVRLKPTTTCTSSFLFHLSLTCTILHVLMRDKKEGRKKQARSNKQQGKATCTCTLYMYVQRVQLCELFHILLETSRRVFMMWCRPIKPSEISTHCKSMQCTCSSVTCTYVHVVP